MPLLSIILFIVAAVFAVAVIIGFAFQVIGFLFAGAIIFGAAMWIRASLRPRS